MSKQRKQLTPRQAPADNKPEEQVAEPVKDAAKPQGGKRYLVTKKSFIDNALRYPGDEVCYSGKAGSNLQLIEE